MLTLCIVARSRNIAPFIVVARVSQLKSKIASIIVAAIYITMILVVGEKRDVFNLIIFLILPMSFIWFSKAMGDYTGSSFGGFRPAITERSPGCAIAFMGWILLLMPIFMVFL